MASKVSLLLKSTQAAGFFSRNISAWTAAITKKHRRIYLRTYPTLLQLPDGSTINIEYHEPVGVIKLPLDLSTLTEEQQKDRLLKRIPRKKIEITEEIDVEFDESRYIKKK